MNDTTTKLRTAVGEMEDDRLSRGTMPRLLGFTTVSPSRFLALAFAAAVAFGCGGPDPPRPTILPPPPPPAPPGVPQNLMVTDRGDDFIRWQWDPVSDAAGYQVQVSIGDDDFDPPDEQAVLPANQIAAEFRDSELTPGTVVHLRVRAFAGSAGSPVYGPFSPTVPGLVAASPATDRMALEAFFHATDGPNWYVNTGWLTPAPLGEWDGVETDADGRVTALGLVDNDLDGTIPPELGRLTNLRELRLGADYADPFAPRTLEARPWNSLSGLIPPELGALGNLTHLILGELGLSGEIPPELGRLANLARLNLSGNGLSGMIPPELGQATNLTRLVLWGNELSGTIPLELADLTNLETLSIGVNSLTGPIPSEFGRLTNLRFLHLAGAVLTGAIPPELGQLAALENLNLGGNALSGSIPPELGRLKNVRELELFGNPLISGPIPPELTDLTPHRYGLSLPDNVCVPRGPPFDQWVEWFWTLDVVRCPDAPSALRIEDRGGDAVFTGSALILPFRIPPEPAGPSPASGFVPTGGI